jgi:hypothetical protein
MPNDANLLSPVIDALQDIIAQVVLLDLMGMEAFCMQLGSSAIGCITFA